MAFMPRDAKWYVADLVVRIRVEGDRRTVVHVNTHLIRADSPAEAYEKARALGRQSETSYLNPRGRKVAVAFLGLSELNVVHEALEDGAELAYTERIGLSNAETRKLVRARSRLAVFAPLPRRAKPPDYASAEVLAEVVARVERMSGTRTRRRKAPPRGRRIARR
jgi:hypothetical protein